MESYTTVINRPVIISFHFLGPTFGWGVRIDGTICLIFKRTAQGWEPSFHKLPDWITMSELCILYDMLGEILKIPGLPAHML